jgi:hypothetical protein
VSIMMYVRLGSTMRHELACLSKVHVVGSASDIPTSVEHGQSRLSVTSRGDQTITMMSLGDVRWTNIPLTSIASHSRPPELILSEHVDDESNPRHSTSIKKRHDHPQKQSP